MKLSFLFFGNQPDEKWALAKQMGIKYAISKLAPELTGGLPPWDYDSLKNSKEIFEQNGLKLIGFEGDQFNMIRIKLGLDGLEEDIEKYIQMLENMGKLGIGLLCYNFMATGWFRTDKNLQERAGALVSGFDAEVADKLPLTKHGIVGADKIWENYAYFLSRVLPAAEKAGVKMALHPDDPPVPILQGIARIFTNANSIRKALALSSSPSHGLTFCQGTYTTMGEDVKSLIQEFGGKGKIFFIHIRDVEGTASNFRETFHDNGPTDMVDMYRAYSAVGFTGPIRSDHVPTMAGESNQQHGYEMKGNLFGIGYMKGIMEALNIKEVETYI
ncbi:mannonate dehydratase [Pedobacter psychroterrae]|uniref:mannonate dehydratase n=1 Tax=Pedobacter psychroterrae TaxID=2530453 RepID=A0A4R0NPC6_9SPHI|nr:mannonate dehydratase [Pedobacter psychroterrae]TCD01553.1 mannonate dehydratase [Pedobacter psychroterrae]